MRQTDILEVLQHFEGVKRCGDGQYMARCPCHDDRKQSLSIGRGEKGVVLKCQAGCDTRDIIARVGIKPRDLFYDAGAKPTERPQIVAVYEYPNGVQKLRKSDKSFSWRRPDGKGGWIYNRQGVPHSLYVAGSLGNVVFIAEGEKDADSLHRLGFDAASGADGAGPGKWRKEYTEQLQGRTVLIFPDTTPLVRLTPRRPPPRCMVSPIMSNFVTSRPSGRRFRSMEIFPILSLFLVTKKPVRR